MDNLRTPPPPIPHRKHWLDWLFLVPALGLTGILGFPLVALALRTPFDNFLAYALSPVSLDALRISLLTSLLSVVLSVMTGTPLAYVLARRTFRGQAFVELMVDLPIVLPPSVAGLALLIAFGREGLVGQTLAEMNIRLPFTLWAVVLAQVFVSAPLFVRTARLGFAEIDPHVEEAALVDGATPWQLFQRVMLPMAGPSLLSGAMLAWTRSLGEFGATILFAGNLQGVTQTMPLAIYLGFERDMDIAIVLSVVLMLVSLGLLAVIRKLNSP